jgi:hypothetical protein
MSSAVVTSFISFYASNFAVLQPLTRTEVMRLFLSNAQTPIEFSEFHEVGQLDMDSVKIYVSVGLAQMQRKQEEESRKLQIVEEKE